MGGIYVDNRSVTWSGAQPSRLGIKILKLTSYPKGQRHPYAGDPALAKAVFLYLLYHQTERGSVAEAPWPGSSCHPSLICQKREMKEKEGECDFLFKTLAVASLSVSLLEH